MNEPEPKPSYRVEVSDTVVRVEIESATPLGQRLQAMFAEMETPEQRLQLSKRIAGELFEAVKDSPARDKILEELWDATEGAE